MNDYISHWWQGSRQPSNSGRHSSGSPPVPAGQYLPGTRPTGANNIGPTRSRCLRDPWSFVLSPRSPRDTTRYNVLAHTEPLSPSLVPSAPLMTNNKLLPETSLESLEFYPEPPPSPELAIRVSDPVSSREMYLMLAEAAHFIQTKSKRVNNTLSFTWTMANDLRGRIIFQNLFEKLNLPIRMDRRTIRPLESFERMTFTVPEKVEDLEPWNVSFDSDTIANDYINFSGATNLLEFSWNGDFCLLASKCVGVPFSNLHALTITGSFMCVEDAIAILHLCPGITHAELGIVDNIVSGARRIVTNIKPSPLAKIRFQWLESLKIVAKEQLWFISERITWDKFATLSLTVSDRALEELPQAIVAIRNIGHLDLTLEEDVKVGDRDKLRVLMKRYRRRG
ncbi:hypothetical protein NLJ89_g3792 [Agrocybe chaxingu]|uniref:Uncharacterized protein n=1 Tax=Agrocybe chaxingu TaxID=84603 RepID=A0A9W8K9H7_9AGAR|nr:hypothetical protein NLJ89_g3792 [Agrocybe chaxingu]